MSKITKFKAGDIVYSEFWGRFKILGLDHALGNLQYSENIWIGQEDCWKTVKKVKKVLHD